ncbi:TIGR03546 family protein [bacterium]
MFWFKMISKFIKILHSNATSKQIGWGFALGAFTGLMPAASPQSLIGLFIILLVNVNMGMAFLSAALFKIIGLFLDMPADFLGSYLLIDTVQLKDFWTALYNTPIIPFTKFNNTVVLGNMIIALIAFVPLGLLGRKGVVFYREKLQEKVERFKIMKIFKATKIYKWYKRLLMFKA